MPSLKIIKSASIILQRSSGEVYLAKRSRSVSFFPTFWVFPGGKIDDDNLRDDWEGTELEVIDTVFKELYEEVGIIAGSDYTVPPEQRSTPFFSQPYNESRRQQFLDAMSYIGKKQTPPFRRKLFDAAYYWLQGVLADELSPQVDGGELDEGEWILPETAIRHWEEGKKRIPPPIVHLLRRISSDHFAAITFAETFLPVGLQTKIEFAPGYQVIPITSDTIEPFFNTNMVIIDDALLVDPGANNEGEAHLREILASLPETPRVFITHHHHDHWVGIKLVEELYPEAIVMGHAKTIDRLETGLQTMVLRDSDFIDGTRKLRVIATPGHADSHMILFDEENRIMVAGDHVVGFGSAVLDPDTGSMSEYFTSTHTMIDLNPKLIIPAHGPPNFAGKQLLQKYLAHRTERENDILSSIQNGAITMNDIVRDVYQDVPEKMWEFAKRNIKLHVDKLVVENRITSQIE